MMLVYGHRVHPRIIIRFIPLVSQIRLGTNEFKYRISLPKVDYVTYTAVVHLIGADVQALEVPSPW